MNKVTSQLDKATGDDFEGRFREVLSDPSNRYIPRIKNAGTMQDGHIVMHNGLLVSPDYYEDFSQILLLNKGVHEPQEERMFMEVLKYISPDATMIELGSYWAFYSMWFQQQIKGAKNFMVEPDKNNLECGIKNFRLNGFRGNFFQGHIGPQGVDLKAFIAGNKIEYLDLLHVDIQGAELFLLDMNRDLFVQKKIGYIFVSTHSQELHLNCRGFLEAHDYLILASADFDNETFCFDGVLVARDKSLEGLNPIQLDVRNSAAV